MLMHAQGLDAAPRFRTHAAPRHIKKNTGVDQKASSSTGPSAASRAPSGSSKAPGRLDNVPTRFLRQLAEWPART